VSLERAAEQEVLPGLRAAALGTELPGPLRALVARVWAVRAAVESDAVTQFARLGDCLEAVGAPSGLAEVARRAMLEEAQHGGLCARLASAYGGVAVFRAEPPAELPPPSLTGREALAYTVVAHCCIAETESVATLTALIHHAGPAEVKVALQLLARDEVEHAQLGWAALTWLHSVRPLAFLEPYLPAMLEPRAEPDLEEQSEGADDPRLAAHGVLPAQRRRAVFLEAMEGVVLPGLARLGVPGRLAQEWVASRASQPS
jgi:hypothetical protein